jgi:hypothetical protein
MNVNLIFFLLIIFLVKTNNNDSISTEKIIKFELSNNITKIKEKISFDYDNNTINITEFIISTYMNDSLLNISLFNISEEIKGVAINYFNIKYQERIEDEPLFAEILNENISFKLVNISYNLLTQSNYSILAMNNFNDKLIFFDYVHKNIIINDNFSNINSLPEEAKDILSKENLCYNKAINEEENRKFICKLDYILFGHEDLPKDDVYLAKQIDVGLSIAYLDNMISYSIFPYEYLDYFFTSFFSELNDGCSQNSYKTDVEGKPDVLFYYITCPKKKIDIYTKRRKLSIIINKFSYRIENLFVDSFDFLNTDPDADAYYFNILFQKDRSSFALGFGFLSKIMFLNYNHSTYIYSKERIDYTEDLTDNSSEDFEKWLYILTACSFTFVLLIFTIIGCFHSKKSNSELKEMIKSNIL